MRRASLAHRVERRLGRTVLRATVRRLVHLFLIRARRQPLRSTTLLGIGGAVGVTAGWIAGRRTAQTDS